jgi:hypothetical protein
LIRINCRRWPLNLPLHLGNFLFWLDCAQTAVPLRVMEGFQWNKSITGNAVTTPGKYNANNLLQFTIRCNEYTIRYSGDGNEVAICRIESVCRLQSKWCKHYFQCYSTRQPLSSSWQHFVSFLLERFVDNRWERLSLAWLSRLLRVINFALRPYVNGSAEARNCF